MNTSFSRRHFAKLTAAAAAVLRLPRLFAQNTPLPRVIAPGPFRPTWESLTTNCKTPERFRDAKFGADVVVNGKHTLPEHIGSFVEGIERSTANAIRPEPWQTDTCIGDWHFSGAIYEENRYQTVPPIASMLTDIVSKNGNLMLNIPLRGDGSIDDKEEAFIAGFTAWMDVNSEGIFATRPWKIYGEGPSTTAPPPRAYGPPGPPYTPEDIRFATKGDVLYAFVGAWPESRVAKIKSLGAGSPQLGGAKIANISLLGCRGKLAWTQGADSLSVNLLEMAPSEHAVTLKIDGLPSA